MMLLDSAGEAGFADLPEIRSGRATQSANRHAEARRRYRLAVAVVARAAGVSCRLVARPIGRAHRRRRYWALYLTVTSLDVPIKVAARVAGVSPTIVRCAVRQTEDARDRCDIDRAITHLEEALTCAA